MTDAIGQVEALAETWLAACRAFDNDRILQLLADDAVIWYNFEQVEHDRAGYRKMLDDAAGYMLNRSYKNVRLHVHEAGFVEQATLCGDVNGVCVETPFLLVASVAHGKIARIEEYFDTTIIHDAGLSQ